MEKARKNILIICSIILLALFLYRIINQSQLITTFPLDRNNDLSSHLGELQFLKDYGFHQNVPNWYTGFKLFLMYPPAWFYLALPLYNLTSNIHAAAYFSELIIFILAFFFIFLLGKISKFKWYESLFLFSIVFANPISIGNFIKVGRFPELLSLALAIPAFTLLIFYLNKKLDVKFHVLLILLLSLVILSHPAYFFSLCFILLGFWIKKDKKEKFQLITSILVIFLITAFWTLPFLKASSGSSFDTRGYTGLYRLIFFQNVSIFDIALSFAMPIVFWFFLFFYKKNNKEIGKKDGDFILYLPLLIWSILFFFRIAAFVPAFNKPYPDAYILFFLFVSAFLFLKTELKSFGKLKKLILILILISIIASVFITIKFVPTFRAHTATDEKIIDVLENISKLNATSMVYITNNIPYPSMNLAFYSYGAIYFNTFTPDGWYPQVASSERINDFELLDAAIKEKDCKTITELTIKYKIDYLITPETGCNIKGEIDI